MLRRFARSFGLAISIAAVVLSLSATAVFAGEVKGPPGQIDNTNDTAAPTHANSACAFSGLNDFNQGQTASIVQTAADSWRYYGLPKGAPGRLGLCQGGTN